MKGGFDKSVVSGRRLYLFCDIDLISTLTEQFSSSAASNAKMVGEHLKTIEFYDTSDTSGELVLKLDDESKDPVQYIISVNRILYRLLSRHINAGQLAGFVLANLCGMTIVLAAVQFATDIIPMFTGNDSFLKPGQMVMAKHVSTVRTLTGKAPTFSAEEIADVSQQPFVKEAGTFTPSLFSVVATLGSRKLGVEFSTEMFFEAVPDDFIDVDLSRWQWHEGDDEVPIILPRNYLDLYNFGFASSQGLPALSESLVSMIKIRFYLRGSAGSKELSGRVVAFSKKLNTILVPQTFMDEMNATLSPDRQPEPSRLILTVSNLPTNG